MGASVQSITSGTVEMEGAEELLMNGEQVEGEQPEQVGFLTSSEGKHYVFTPQDQTPLSQKCTELFSETSKPKEQKSFDSQGEMRPLSYEESIQIRTKEFQTQKSEKPETDTPSKSSTPAKSDQKGRETLKTADHPPPTRPAAGRLMDIKGGLRTRGTVKEEVQEKKREEQKSERREEHKRDPIERQPLREQVKTDQLRDVRQEREEQEEGFSEDQKRQEQEDDPEGDEHGIVNAIEKKGIDPKEILAYGNEESALLSDLLKMRVSHFDVLFLFFEVMKLALKGREEERADRMVERALQLQHIDNMVENFKKQGKNMLFANLVSGIFAIISGIAPIVGHLKGEAILDTLSGFTNRFRDMDSDKFFKMITKVTFALSEMQKSYGQIQNTFAESTRTYDQHMAEIRKTDWEEDTRTMDELKDEWKGIENFLHQSLQMYHDTIRQLYNA